MSRLCAGASEESEEVACQNGVVAECQKDGSNHLHEEEIINANQYYDGLSELVKYLGVSLGKPLT